MTATYRIDVYDAQRHEWRQPGFLVTADEQYEPKCGNGLHQFQPGAKVCACGTINRNKETN